MLFLRCGEKACFILIFREAIACLGKKPIDFSFPVRQPHVRERARLILRLIVLACLIGFTWTHHDSTGYRRSKGLIPNRETDAVGATCKEGNKRTIPHTGQPEWQRTMSSAARFPA